MKKLILATASVLALGLATSGAGYAQQPSNNTQPPESSAPSATTPPAANMPATGQSSPNGTPQQEQMNSTAPMHLSQTQLRQVQQKLKAKDLYKGEIDGKMGPDTREAIAKFQKQNGLQGTGQIDQQTLAALGDTGMNGTVGEGSSSMPGNQPANTNGLNTGHGHHGTNGSGSSTMPGNQPSNAGSLNNGSGNMNLPSGTNATQPGANGSLSPSTTTNNH